MEFDDIMKEIRGHTCVGEPRCHMLYVIAKSIAWNDGDVAEVGVWKGGTAKLLAEAFKGTGKTIHLFDTFVGMPPCDPNRDSHKQGDFKDVSLIEVEKYLDGYSNVRFYPGFFPDTAKEVNGSRFCLVHIDADIYRSIKDSCEFFYPRMSVGGVIVFDDYGSPTCPGAKIAVDDFFMDKPEKIFHLVGSQWAVSKRQDIKI